MPRRTNTREAILEAASTLLREKGEHAVTTRAVTKIVGISQPTFYAHFESVDELIVELASRVAANLIRLLRESQAWLRTNGPKDPERLVEHYEGVLQRALAQRSLIEVYLRHRWLDSSVGEFCREVDRTVESSIIDHVITTSDGEGPTSDYHEVRQFARVVSHGFFSALAVQLEMDINARRMARLLALQTLAAVDVFFGPQA
ncbi:MAG: TetR/AcrR family transcriptional regulator [Myxococcota bacterium]